MLGLADVRAALEHHVLEQVREAGLARDLVLRADVVPEVHGDHGREVVLGDDQAQPVRQALIAELDDGNGHAQQDLGDGRWVDADCRPSLREPRVHCDGSATQRGASLQSMRV